MFTHRYKRHKHLSLDAVVDSTIKDAPRRIKQIFILGLGHPCLFENKSNIWTFLESIRV